MMSDVFGNVVEGLDEELFTRATFPGFKEVKVNMVVHGGGECIVDN